MNWTWIAKYLQFLVICIKWQIVKTSFQSSMSLSYPLLLDAIMCAKHGGCCCRWNAAPSSIPSSPQGKQYPSRQWPHRRKPQATDAQMKHFWPSKNRIWERQNVSRKPSRKNVKNQKGLSVSWGWGSTTGSWGQGRRNTREGNISQSFWGLVSDRAVLFGFGCLTIVIKEVPGCVPASPMSAESCKATLLSAPHQSSPAGNTASPLSSLS